MDPNIDTEEPGLSQGRAQAEDGVAYLRRLKGQAADGAADSPMGEHGGSDRIAGTSPAVKERRRSPRFLCSGSVAFQAEGSDVRLWGTLTDVSLHGCYVEMSTTFPVDTKVSLGLESLGIRVQVQAMVRLSYPFLGMGMCFTEIEPGQQTQLEYLLSALAGQRALLNGSPAEQTGLPEILASADPWACLDEIAEYLRKNPAISREEFYQIAKRVRRS